MASDGELVITAIRDMGQEGFVAASLKSSGWRIVYRATSVASLREKLKEYPEALLLLSDDFGDFDEMNPARLVILRGRSHPRRSSSALDPKSEFELMEIIRSRTSHKSSQHISATSANVFAVSSIGGCTGATTVAITITEQITRLGHSVLLVDGNRINPKIAHHFQTHNIRKEISLSQHGFSLCEATSLSGLQQLAKEANNFDFIVVDLGVTSLSIEGGQRVEDLLKSWIDNSRARKIVTSRDDERSSDVLRLYLDGQKLLPQGGDVTVFFLPSKVLSRKERKSLIEQGEQTYKTSVGILSSDPRSIMKMEKSHSTLSFSAPQSPITSDIAQYLERERYS